MPPRRSNRLDARARDNWPKATPLERLGVDRSPFYARRVDARLRRSAKLVVVEGGPRGMCTTMKDRVNEELLRFAKE
jgi:hypothetical protein